MRFCGKCTNPLALACPNCHFENPPEFKFCGQCTTALVAGSSPSSSNPHIVSFEKDPGAALDGERKTVSALFADIKDSTELMAKLDPEDARSIVDPALKLMIEAVRRYDGYIVQSTGDGIFALFGAPLAHEDHPQRALYSALRMQEELSRYCAGIVEEGGNPIQCRVGINSGEVVVRSISTGDAHTEYTPIGHTTNLAARMQAVAPVGSIAVSDTTRHWCEGYFAFKSLGLTRLKGVPDPIEVHEVIGLGPLRTRLERAAARGLTKFVGRERDIETLKRALEQARNGHGQIVGAIAEAGVGKSRLFYEFRVTSQSEYRVLEGFSVSHGKASPFLPVIDLLRNYFRIGNDDDEHTRREKVIGTILAVDPNLEDTVPYLFTVLGIVGREDPLAQMDGQVKKQRTLEAIKRILLRESLKQTLMLVCEDLHWIDEQTQEFLNLLVDSIGSARILLLVSYRPEYRHPWGQKTYYTQLRLDPLANETAIEMLTMVLGPGAELAPLKQLIIDRTQGNPFFMEEIVQALFEEGALVRNGEVNLSRPLYEIRIPPTVQAILTARIDRLPRPEKELLQTAAVLGNQFGLNLVGSTFGESETEIEQRLSDLQATEFIYERAALGDKQYTFKHALTQEAAYKSILLDRRKQIHERAAEALEKLYAGRQSEIVDELARHYVKSGNVSKAIEYLQYAGDLALARSFFPEAIEKLNGGLELVRAVPEEKRARQELALQLRLGTAYSGALGFASEGREKAFRRAMELCDQIEGDRETFPVIWNLCQLNLQRAELSAAHDLANQGLSLAERIGEPEFIMAAHYNLGEICSLEGALRESLEHLERASELYDPRLTADLFAMYSLDFLVSVAPVGTTVECLMGWSDKALKRAQAAQRHTEALANSFSSAFLQVALRWASVIRRDVHETREITERMLVVCTENGFTNQIAWAKCFHGWALIEQARPREGIAEMYEGIAILDEIRDAYSRTMFFAMLAEGYEKLGDNTRAMKLIDDALERAHRTGERFYEPELHRLKGELHLTTTPAEAECAEYCFRTAINIAHTQEAKLWELRAINSLARLLRDTGRDNQARTMLTDIYQWFTEGFNTADLKEAELLLDQLP
jgi:class 3 adenylate cyclase/predicted ATPase